MWQAYQRLRLAQERDALQHQAPEFEFYDLTGSTYIAGFWTSNQNRSYGIRIEIPAAYPDTMPDTYVTYPSPLRGFYKPMESYGSSHNMHTWLTDVPGWTKICIVRPEDWSAAYSIMKILTKARLWITAYECHLDDGTDIRFFLV
jgi:hypothetical protein